MIGLALGIILVGILIPDLFLFLPKLLLPNLMK